MGNFNRHNKSGKSQMHQAVCDECGRDCEVPFKPSSGKPIYCSDCFEGRGRGNKRSNRKDFGDKNSRRSSMHRAICDNCGKSCEVPFRPTSGKPIYCDTCFDKRNKKDEKSTNDEKQLNQQLKELNEKLDKVLNLLSGLESISKTEKKTETKKKSKKVAKNTKKKTLSKKPTKKKSTKKTIKTKKKK